MIVKIIGIIILLTSSSLLGFVISNKYKTRVRELKEIRNHFQMIETEIIYTATPIIEVMDKISQQAKEPFKDVYKNIALELRKKEGESLGSIWRKAFDDKKNYTRLNKEDLETIIFFGNVLGTSDRENQLKNSQLIQSQLSKLEEIAEEERQRSEKLYKNLGALLGLALTIILI
ncbi:stage III sporulation protein SpoIIIAB [Irregularibacter muris]|uniref:Stage III sporulation protein SpoIIIAB n=1 Tax=Irregularibacter muris TaxID=1796619 RepID=A0AAE3HF29_9FIRM|nr:stage III sporulation protein SpoIIIAB [Irregularibacter muris]MCR1897988.1 stage III sporulation protein SpoIIIAB [Irregularibacter muris]